MVKSLTGLGLSLIWVWPVLAGDNWPQWRGPALDGTSDSTHLPTTWSETQNIRWKTALPSWGAATPAVWGERIFVMSGSEVGDGQVAETLKPGPKLEREGRELYLLCLARKNGEILWRRKLDDGNLHYNKQNMASPSPCTDGKIVWAMTGSGVLAAFDMAGEPLWRHELQKDYGEFQLGYGYASSPLLWGDSLFVEVLHGSEAGNRGYLVAFDARKGAPLWKVERKTDAVEESPDAYTTPTLMTTGGRTELIIGGADYITAHDPATGQEIWRCGGLNLEHNPRYRAVCSPVVAAGLVFMCCRQGPLVACKGGGQGDVTATHLAWSSEAAPDVPTPACDGKYLYVLHDRGMLSCIDVKTGEPAYLKQRLPAGTYSASPLLADGKLYVTSERARTTVLATGPEFKILAENELDDGHTLSSIAVAGRELFVRTAKSLYCISEPAGP